VDLIVVLIVIVLLVVVRVRVTNKNKIIQQENALRERNIAVEWYREHIMSQKKDKVKKNE
jgi:predicted Holliday junction resolvase-like endonuclease